MIIKFLLLQILSTLFIINGNAKLEGQNCFNDCMTSNSYSGIRSVTRHNTPCIKWNESTKFKRFHHNDVSSHCKINVNFKKKESYTWCATKSNWEYCDVPLCSEFTYTKCVTITATTSTSNSISGSWSNENEFKGYLILLQNKHKECVNYIIQNNWDIALSITVKNFYISCKQFQSSATMKMNEFKFGNLLNGHKYNIFIIPIIDSDNVGTIRNLTIQTQILAPQVPQDLKVIKTLKTNFLIGWKVKVTKKYGRPRGYKLKIWSDNNNFTEDTKLNYITLSDLTGCTKYYFAVQSYNDVGYSEFSETICEHTQAPKLGNIKINKMKSGYSTNKLISWKYEGTDKCPKLFTIMYKPVDEIKYDILKTNKTSVTITNLTVNMKYEIKLVVTLLIETENQIQNQSVSGYFYTGNDTNVLYLVLGVIGVIMIIILVIVFIGIKRKNILVARRNIKVHYDVISNVVTTPNMKNKSKSIPIENFSFFIQSLEKDNFKTISLEYIKLVSESLEIKESLNLTANIGQLDSNSSKNRFINILPYDQSRVLIQSKSFPDNYINASYISFAKKAEEKGNEYLACQGPNEYSIGDFWQMIWEQNVTCIVMLTKTLEENAINCLQYWPSTINSIQSFDWNISMEILLKSENILDSYIEREMTITNQWTQESRNVYQLQMTTWSDNLPPAFEYFDTFLLKFHRLTKKKMCGYPYLIHCSSGIGSTGTFITIDRIVKQLMNGCREIDIYNTVLDLRKYRFNMVQKRSQYIFIYQYIDHFLKEYKTNYNSTLI